MVPFLLVFWLACAAPAAEGVTPTRPSCCGGCCSAIDCSSCIISRPTPRSVGGQSSCPRRPVAAEASNAELSTCSATSAAGPEGVGCAPPPGWPRLVHPCSGGDWAEVPCTAVAQDVEERCALTSVGCAAVPASRGGTPPASCAQPGTVRFSFPEFLAARTPARPAAPLHATQPRGWPPAAGWVEAEPPARPHLRHVLPALRASASSVY